MGEEEAFKNTLCNKLPYQKSLRIRCMLLRWACEQDRHKYRDPQFEMWLGVVFTTSWSGTGHILPCASKQTMSPLNSWYPALLFVSYIPVLSWSRAQPWSQTSAFTELAAFLPPDLSPLVLLDSTAPSWGVGAEVKATFLVFFFSASNASLRKSAAPLWSLQRPCLKEPCLSFDDHFCRERKEMDCLWQTQIEHHAYIWGKAMCVD